MESFMSSKGNRPDRGGARNGQAMVRVVPPRQAYTAGDGAAEQVELRHGGVRGRQNNRVDVALTMRRSIECEKMVQKKVKRVEEVWR